MTDGPLKTTLPALENVVHHPAANALVVQAAYRSRMSAVAPPAYVDALLVGSAHPQGTFTPLVLGYAQMTTVGTIVPGAPPLAIVIHGMPDEKLGTLHAYDAVSGALVWERRDVKTLTVDVFDGPKGPCLATYDKKELLDGRTGQTLAGSAKAAANDAEWSQPPSRRKLRHEYSLAIGDHGTTLIPPDGAHAPRAMPPLDAWPATVLLRGRPNHAEKIHPVDAALQRAKRARYADVPPTSADIPGEDRENHKTSSGGAKVSALVVSADVSTWLARWLHHASPPPASPTGAKRIVRVASRDVATLRAAGLPDDAIATSLLLATGLDSDVLGAKLDAAMRAFAAAKVPSCFVPLARESVTYDAPFSGKKRPATKWTAWDTTFAASRGASTYAVPVGIVELYVREPPPDVTNELPGLDLVGPATLLQWLSEVVATLRRRAELRAKKDPALRAPGCREESAAPLDLVIDDGGDTDVVSHPKFGRGRVVSQVGDKLEIRFEDGSTRKLLASVVTRVT